MIILDLKIIFCFETKTQFQFCYVKCKVVRNTQLPTGVEGLYVVLLEIILKLADSKPASNFMIQSSTVYIVPSDQTGSQ